MSENVLGVRLTREGDTVTPNVREVLRGLPGADGVSPVVTIEKTGKKTVITITDKDGEKTAEILDGADGDQVTGENVIAALGYAPLREHQSLEEYAKKSEIPDVPEKLSELENDAGYLKEHQDISGKQDVIDDLEAIREGAEKGMTALQEHQSLSEYAKKSEIPDVPEKLSELENDAGYLTDESASVTSQNAKIAKLEEDVEGLVEERLLTGKRDVFLYDCALNVGDTYAITNVGSAASTLSVYDASGEQIEELSYGFTVGQTITYTPTQTVSYIGGWCPQETQIKVANLSKRLPVIEKKIETANGTINTLDEHVDDFKRVISDICEEKVLSGESGVYSYKCTLTTGSTYSFTNIGTSAISLEVYDSSKSLIVQVTDGLISGNTITYTPTEAVHYIGGWCSGEAEIKVANVSKRLPAVEQAVKGKQDVISDLDTIRSGAALGATALQSVPYGKFELIEQFSTESASAWSRDTEPNGTPYNFRNVMIVFETTTSDSITGGTLYLGSNSGSLSGNNQLVQNYISAVSAESKISIFKTKRETGLIYCERIMWVGLNDNTYYVNKVGQFFKNTSSVDLNRVKSINFDNGETIKKIACTAAIPSSVIIYIFAERA